MSGRGMGGWVGRRRLWYVMRCGAGWDGMGWCWFVVEGSSWCQRDGELYRRYRARRPLYLWMERGRGEEWKRYGGEGEGR